MAVQVLKVQNRSANGTKQVRKLRYQGYVPAVVYGGKQDPLSVQVTLTDIGRELRAHRRVFELEVEGGSKEGVYMQDVQFDCLSDLPMHVDFVRVDLEKPLEVEIVLTFSGHPKGLVRGGKFRADVTKLPLSCRPDAIPYEIEIGIAELDLDDQILAKDVKLPDGASLNVPEDTVICSMAL